MGTTRSQYGGMTRRDQEAMVNIPLLIHNLYYIYPKTWFVYTNGKYSINRTLLILFQNILYNYKQPIIFTIFPIIPSFPVQKDNGHSCKVFPSLI